MGYTTEFTGKIEIVPALNETEIKYIQQFNDTRRMERTNGAYFVGGTGMCGQGQDDDIINYNQPPQGQPSLWCQVTCSDDGKYLEWDGGEKAYSMEIWMLYIIKHFLGKDPIARQVNKSFGFLKGHMLNGTLAAEGESHDDNWQISVIDNVVYKQEHDESKLGLGELVQVELEVGQLALSNSPTGLLEHS